MFITINNKIYVFELSYKFVFLFFICVKKNSPKLVQNLLMDCIITNPFIGPYLYRLYSYLLIGFDYFSCNIYLIHILKGI